MPILDDDAADKLLAHWLKPGTVTLPTEYTVELWDGDPTLEDSAELSGNGYAAPTVTTGSPWSTPESRMATASPTFAAPTGEWVPATHHVLRGDDGLGYWYGVLAEPLYVTAAGSPPAVTVAVFIEDPDPED